jgi:hypothetical protein
MHIRNTGTGDRVLHGVDGAGFGYVQNIDNMSGGGGRRKILTPSSERR